MAVAGVAAETHTLTRCAGHCRYDALWRQKRLTWRLPLSDHPALTQHRGGGDVTGGKNKKEEE